MTIEKIKEAFGPIVSAKGMFFVDVEISKENDITITVESEKGTVDLNDCVDLSHSFEALFSRDEEDYSLTVSSAGLDQPFKVEGQFKKAIGSKVEVSLKGGRKFVAVLSAFEEDGATLEYTTLEIPEGGKKKVKVEKVEKIAPDKINAMRPFIEFE